MTHRCRIGFSTFRDVAPNAADVPNKARQLSTESHFQLTLIVSS